MLPDLGIIPSVTFILYLVKRFVFHEPPLVMFAINIYIVLDPFLFLQVKMENNNKNLVQFANLSNFKSRHKS